MHLARKFKASSMQASGHGPEENNELGMALSHIFLLLYKRSAAGLPPQNAALALAM